jgi:hypothetical protein
MKRVEDTSLLDSRASQQRRAGVVSRVIFCTTACAIARHRTNQTAFGVSFRSDLLAGTGFIDMALACCTPPG